MTCRKEEDIQRQSRQRTSVTMTTMNTSPPLGVRREDSLNNVLVETTTDLDQILENEENSGGEPY